MTEKIRKDSSKPHPRINQYPTNKEGLQGIRPTTEDYKAQGVIIPCVLQSVTHQETQWPWIEICARPPYCKWYCYPSSPCSQPSHLSSFHSYWKQAFHCEWVLLLSFVVQSLWCLTLCNPTDCSMPGLPVLHYLPVFAQTHAHWVDDAIQPSHPLSPPSPPALNLSQHQGLF